MSISPLTAGNQAACVDPPAGYLGRHPVAFLAYLGGLVGGLALLTAAVDAGGLHGTTLWVTVFLAFVAAVGERVRVPLAKDSEISISLLPTLFAAVTIGPLAAIVVGGAAMLGDFRRPYARWVLYTSIGALGGGLTALVVDWSASLTTNELAEVLIGTMLGAVAIQVLDIAFGSVVVLVRRINPLVGAWRTMLPVVPSSLVVLVGVVAPVALAYEQLSPLVLPFFLLPALAMHRLYVMYQEQRALARDLATLNAQLEKANLSFAVGLVAALDARDRYTAGHSAAVAVYARDIAAEIGLSASEQRLAHLAGLVHDIGKIGVPPGVLEKPGPLSLHERRLMERHSEVGERILAKVEAYGEIAEIVRHHHERIDGLGYPDGVMGDAIPLISRIICVADAYNAMTSDRPYREAMSPTVARARLAQAARSQFDADVVAAFDRILERSTSEYAMASWADYHREAEEHPELELLREPQAA